MKIIIVITIIVLVAIAGFVYMNSSSGDYSGLFRDELSRAGVERVGQPIEGFNAYIYLEAFPGFEEVDFDGVETFEGIYRLEDKELKYERTVGNPVTSAEETISEEGYKTLLVNFSDRLGVKVRSESDIAVLLERLRESDEVQGSYITDDFSIWHPEGWYPYKNNRSVFFTHDENLEIPANTDGFAMAPWFQVTVLMLDNEGGSPTSVEEMFARNLWVEGSEFLISKVSVLIDGKEAIKLVTKAAGAAGEVLHYVFNPDEERIFTLSLYPYEPGSQDTDDFERAVRTFMPNYINVGSITNFEDCIAAGNPAMESYPRQCRAGDQTFVEDISGSGGAGILPFDSGVSGRVLLGPTCPVMKDPPDPSCADKPFVTTIQVIEVGSPKSSPFSVVESDKDGEYKVILPPGEYSLQAVGDIPFPRCEWGTVTIESSTMLELDLLCDTGIR
ncbi:hypothetical protein CL629_02390 [bacterium]|nr:hypothetical protein [bacterium]